MLTIGVSVPYGDCGSYRILVFLEHGTRRSRFRPLTGIVVLICEACSVAAERRIYHPTFPSPYGDRGSYLKLTYYVVEPGDTFPSPYGDYGSYRSWGLFLLEALLQFPSPYGDYGSYRRHLF